MIFLSKVGLNSVDLSQTIEGSFRIPSLHFVSTADKYISAFQHFSKCFGDSLALGGFDYVGKISG